MPRKKKTPKQPQDQGAQPQAEAASPPASAPAPPVPQQPSPPAAPAAPPPVRPPSNVGASSSGNWRSGSTTPQAAPPAYHARPQQAYYGQQQRTHAPAFGQFPATAVTAPPYVPQRPPSVQYHQQAPHYAQYHQQQVGGTQEKLASLHFQQAPPPPPQWQQRPQGPSPWQRPHPVSQQHAPSQFPATQPTPSQFPVTQPEVPPVSQLQVPQLPVEPSPPLPQIQQAELPSVAAPQAEQLSQSPPQSKGKDKFRRADELARFVPEPDAKLFNPSRPSWGTKGVICPVYANHFAIPLPKADLHQYDVKFEPKVVSRMVCRMVINELIKVYRRSTLGSCLPAFDGRANLYTARELPFITHQFEVTLVDEPDGNTTTRRERKFTVVLNHVGRASLEHVFRFLRSTQRDAPHTTLQVLDIVLRQLPTERYSPVGRSFYSRELGNTRQLGNGLESYRGFYQSVRPTQMGLSLNIDMSSTAFIEAIPVLEFVKKLLTVPADRRGVGGGGRGQEREIEPDLNRPLSDADRHKIKKALKGVKVEVTHRGPMRRKYRIAGLTYQPTQELEFTVDNAGTIKSVVDYFRETYGHTIRNPSLPCLQVGNQQRPNYLPMEVCKIVEGQRYSKRLNEKQINELLKVTCQRPHDRMKDIKDTVSRNNYNNDPYAKEFGINIDRNLASVEARILPAPMLQYGETGAEKICTPKVGQWNMMNKKMFTGGTVKLWAAINFGPPDKAVPEFLKNLVDMCRRSGMEFEPIPVFETRRANPDRVETALKSLCMDARTWTKGKELDLLIAILPDSNGALYGHLKRICETDLGVISQCCLMRHVRQSSPQYLANVSLKINVKVGGRNTVLVDALKKRLPLLTADPTIVFGADVTHPHPGEDSSPSIAAVVASQDWPEITKYAGLVSAQAHRQELIQDLYTQSIDPKTGTIVHGGMVRELLLAYYRATRRKPERILFYRDGVSEGQFHQVLFEEVDAIRKGCASLEANYLPPITFVVVQKRHHTRLFAQRRDQQDRSGNIQPGTVVDTKICHPTEFDFYLCSHAGIQGTSRPAHYHVLWDENKFSADDLQELTNNLCYTYARCTRSVSIVPPAYYAHLAAFRARFYMEPEPQVSGGSGDGRGGAGSGGGASGGSGGRQNPRPVRPLPRVKDNVKSGMFYC